MRGKLDAAAVGRDYDERPGALNPGVLFKAGGTAKTLP